jgi:hypothetical protein
MVPRARLHRGYTGSLVAEPKDLLRTARLARDVTGVQPAISYNRLKTNESIDLRRRRNGDHVKRSKRVEWPAIAAGPCRRAAFRLDTLAP